MAKANGVTTRELRKIETQALGAANRIERAMGNVGASFKAFGAGFIGGLGLQQLATAAQSAIKSIADIGDAAQRLGLTTDEYQQMAFAAQLAGVETDQLAAGLKKLGVNSSEAARGNGELGEILKLNNVSITDANGKLLSQTEILQRVAELVRNAASEQDQMAIAYAAFGKSGINILGLLEQGASGVAAAMGSAKNDTIQFTQEQIEAAQRFDDQIDTLINTISVGLKSSFIDAASGAESFANTTLAALDSVGIKAENITQSLLAALKYNPIAISSTLAIDALKKQGQAVNSAAQAGATISGEGKGDLPQLNARPTILPVKPLAAPAASRSNSSPRQSSVVQRAVAERDAVADLVSQLKFEGEQLRRNDLQQQINSELRRAGVTATSEQGKSITALVTANYQYAQSQEAAKLSEESRLERMGELRDAQMELASTFVDAMDAIMIQGRSADEVLKNLVKTLASQSLQGLLLGQGPSGALFGAGKGGGLFGALFGGLPSFDVGSSNVPRDMVAKIHKGEMIVPTKEANMIRRGGSGGSSLVFAPTINAQNADKAAIASLQNQLYTMKRDFSKMVEGSFNRSRNHNPGFA
jgi:hypothetical protein